MSDRTITRQLDALQFFADRPDGSLPLIHAWGGRFHQPGAYVRNEETGKTDYITVASRVWERLLDLGDLEMDMRDRPHGRLRITDQGRARLEAADG